jgi:hypothetical protein
MSGGNPFVPAWRIDTITGTMEFCTYDPGGYPIGRTIRQENIDCAPAPPVPKVADYNPLSK